MTDYYGEIRREAERRAAVEQHPSSTSAAAAHSQARGMRKLKNLVNRERWSSAFNDGPSSTPASPPPVTRVQSADLSTPPTPAPTGITRAQSLDDGLAQAEANRTMDRRSAEQELERYERDGVLGDDDIDRTVDLVIFWEVCQQIACMLYGTTYRYLAVAQANLSRPISCCHGCFACSSLCCAM